MPVRNYQDVIVGILIAVFGLAVAVYAANNYNIGTLQRMGPGMFPLAIGGTLIFLGLLLGMVSWVRESASEFPEVQWRAFFLVLLSVALFAVSVQTVGLIPAVIFVVCVSSFAEKNFRLVSIAILSIVLCVLAYLIFKMGLGMNFILIRWPF